MQKSDNIRVYFGNLPVDINRQEFAKFIIEKSNLFKYIDKRLLLFIPLCIDEHTLVIIVNEENLSTWRSFSIHKEQNVEKLIDEELQKLNGQEFNNHNIVVKKICTQEFGQLLLTKILNAKRNSESYSFSDDKTKEIWDKTLPHQWERKKYDSMPSFVKQLNFLAEHFCLDPIKVDDKFLSILLPAQSFCNRDFWVYEVMSHNKSTLFVEAFIRVGKPYVKCWRGIVLENDSGQIFYIPEGQSWRENFRDFVSELEMTIKKI